MMEINPYANICTILPFISADPHHVLQLVCSYLNSGILKNCTKHFILDKCILFHCNSKSMHAYSNY